MAKTRSGNPLYDVLRAPTRRYESGEIAALFGTVGKERVNALARMLADYISVNLPAAIEKRDGLAHYRTNPYVLLASASVMDLSEPKRFASFLFNNKLYMGLETSFGKSIESAVLGHYPVGPETAGRWIDPPEKLAEAEGLADLTREEKARKRRLSVWREVDKSCVVGDRRYLVSVKSGPNCINDTQVQAMTDAITANHAAWLAATKQTYPGVDKLDVIVGLTYGTDRTTNNKENQILVKLLEGGFVEENRRNLPGVLVSKKGKATRVYRRVGMDFWASVGNPVQPAAARFVFLEVLLALAKALKLGAEKADFETRINLKIQALRSALAALIFPRHGLPQWIEQSFTDTEFFWLATALTAFYDEGI